VKIRLAFLGAVCLFAPAPPVLVGEPRPASELLACSIAYHDPKDRWNRGAFKITDVSTRPDGTVGRRTVLRIDNARGRFEIETHVESRVVTAAITGDKVKDIRLDGKVEYSEEEAKRFQLSSDQLLTKRNFFLYLLGLPMKLRDPGAHLDPVGKDVTFHGVPSHELRVTYDVGVGSDTWYFYLDAKNCALVGHRFYHDEAKQDGEYAVLSGEISGQGLRLPRIRKWYRNQDDQWFITHTVESIEALASDR
jgi:hypothetical protein